MVHQLGFVLLRLQPVPQPEVLEAFLAFALPALSGFAMTVVVHGVLVVRMVGGANVGVAGEAGLGLSATVLVVGSQLLVLLRGLEVHLVLDLRLLLRALLDLGQPALDARDVLSLRQRPHLGGLVDLGVGAEEVVDAHRGNLHLFLVDRRSDLHQDAVFEQSADHLPADQVDLSLSVLDAALPVALVKGTVSPEHLAVALALVLHEVALVEVAAREVELSIPLLEPFCIVA